MNSDFCELILTLDTREKDRARIQAISDFFESNGAIIIHEALPRCDYKIEGQYKNISINLGIEYKTLLGDFFPSLDSLPGKLFEAYHYYNEVALFVEEGSYAIRFTDDGLDAWVQNPAVQAITGTEGIGTLAMYNNFCGSMSDAGVHVRTIKTVNHFPITVSGLIKHIVKPVHRGIAMNNPDKDFYTDMMNVMAKLPGVGAKTAEKGLKYIPNLERFNSMSLSDLRDIFGKVQGGKLYAFITNSSRVKECSKNWNELYTKNAPKRYDDVTKTIEKNKTKVNVLTVQESPVKRIPEDLQTKDNSNVKESQETDPVHSILWLHVIEFIRQRPRTLEEVKEEFGFTQEHCFKILMNFKKNNKIWYENSTKLWTFGLDKNPVPVAAVPEMDIGV